MARTNRTAKVVAEICLYGTQAVGAGWLARTIDGRMFGNGEPVSTRSMTSAVWLACDDLRRAGVNGTVRIFEPSGHLVSSVSLDGLKHRAIPYFGDLKWEPAPSYTLNVEAAL